MKPIQLNRNGGPWRVILLKTAGRPSYVKPNKSIHFSGDDIKIGAQPESRAKDELSKMLLMSELIDSVQNKTGLSEPDSRTLPKSDSKQENLVNRVMEFRVIWYHVEIKTKPAR
jgi:hypothetical protein